MQLLVSVNAVTEATLVLSAGVSLVDLKDTSYGALSMLGIEVSRHILYEVQRYRHAHPGSDVTVSATIGDECASADVLRQRMDERLAIGVDIIKLPAVIWQSTDYRSILQEYLARKVRLIAVFSPAELNATSVEDQLTDLAAQGYFGVMVDTLNKRLPVTEQVPLDLLEDFTKQARQLKLFTGLAGGLQAEALPALASLHADFLGFRSGLCEKQQRENGLSAQKVQLMAKKMSDIYQ